jgi:hypothetical protein
MKSNETFENDARMNGGIGFRIHSSIGEVYVSGVKQWEH